MNKLKVLVIDIETSPLIAYVWGLKDQNVGLNQITKDSHVIAWAAKWLGSPASQVMYRDQRNAKHIEDDKALLKPLWKLLDEADIVITQNGQRFDGPRLNARFIMHGMNPPSPYKHLDTYQIVKRVAQFTSNKLEYLTQKLCVKYKKLSHSKFPGMTLWDQCLKGSLKAWNEMRRYNIHDVLATEELYMKIKAWAPDAMPKVYEGPGCKICGHSTLTSWGFYRKSKAVYKRFNCRNCGAWQIGEKVSNV